MTETDEPRCPHCGWPLPPIQDQTTVKCSFCGTELDLLRSLCPGCGLVNLARERFCARCGTAIVRQCPSCRHDNWAGREQCDNCGQPLDLLEIMTRPRVRDTRARLDEQQREAQLIKQHEAAQSEVRMAHFRELERQRQQELTRQAVLRRRHERQIIASIVVFGGLILIAILVVLFVLTLTGP